jgi:hypothetical protein
MGRTAAGESLSDAPSIGRTAMGDAPSIPTGPDVSGSAAARAAGRAVRMHSVSAAGTGDGPPSIAAELALIEGAQTALRAHAPDRALRFLNEHAARFPKGALGEERYGLRAIALCNLGRSEAVALATRFLVDHPASPLAGPVRDACALAHP